MNNNIQPKIFNEVTFDGLTETITVKGDNISVDFEQLEENLICVQTNSGEPLNFRGQAITNEDKEDLPMNNGEEPSDQVINEINSIYKIIINSGSISDIKSFCSR